MVAAISVLSRVRQSLIIVLDLPLVVCVVTYIAHTILILFILFTGYKKFQTVGLTGYHLLHLSAVDAEKGSKINLTLACKSVRAMLLDEKFLILGTIDVRVQNGSALIFTFTAP